MFRLLLFVSFWCVSYIIVDIGLELCRVVDSYYFSLLAIASATFFKSSESLRKCFIKPRGVVWTPLLL